MKSALSLVATVALTACSTPKPVLDQANFSAGLVANLQVELNEFDRVQTAAMKARQQSIARQLDDANFIASHARIDEAARMANGDTGPKKLADKISQVSAAYADESATSKASAAAIEQEMAGLNKPLPSTASQTLAAQKALTAMGSELSTKTRFDEAKAFYEVVKKGVEEDKEKLKAAEEAAKEQAKKATQPAAKGT